MNNNAKILAALLGGAALGAVLGVLFAPEEGAETRRKIADGARGWADSLRDRMHEAKNTVNDFTDKAFGKAETVLNETERTMNNTNSKVKV